MTGLIFIPVNWVFAKLIKILFIKKTEPRFVGNAVGVTFIVQYIYIIAYEELVPVTGGWYGGAIQGAAVIVICLISSPIIISSIALLFYSNLNKLILSLYAILLITLSTQFSLYTLIKPRRLPEIELYGRIIDQNNEPVSGSIIYFSGVRDGKYFGDPIESIASNSKETVELSGLSNVVTDNDGLFHIKGYGREIILYPKYIIAKSYDIRVPQKSGHSPYKRNIIISYYYQDRSYVEDIKKYSRETPYTINAWKFIMPKKDTVVMGSHVNVRLNPNNTPYTLIENDKNKLRFKEADKNGYLKVSCKRDEFKNHLDKIDWKLTITPVNGGIQKTEDYYLNEAPESGYRESLVYSDVKNSMEYKSRLDKEMFYFYANNREEYGSVLFNFDSKSREGCLFSAEYIKINKDGERNLYYQVGVGPK